MRAVRFAADAHAGQTRKGSGEPYLTHPLGVMTILAGSGWADENLLAAAALHDVLEDTAVTTVDLAERFPPRVCELVEALSEKKRDADGRKIPWETRKAEHRSRLATAEPAVRALALADKLHNLRCLEADLAAGADVWALFNAPRERWLEVTEETVAALRCERTEALTDACRASLGRIGS
ncbi:MAG: HD domain-containing protein [Planctomycetota bacterium]